MTGTKTTRRRMGASPHARPQGRPVKGKEVLLTADIIRAGRRLFFEKGYENTSTDEVAAAAKCSKRTIYARFSTKVDLFEAVVLDFVAEKRSLTNPRVLAGRTLRDRLLVMAETTVETFLQPDVTALYFLVHREAGRFPELVRIVEASGRKPSVDEMVALLSDGGMQGDLEFFAEQFFSLIHGPLMRYVIQGNTEVTDELLEQARRSADFFLKGCGWGS